MKEENVVCTELPLVGPSHAFGCCCSLHLFPKCFPVICAVFSDVSMSLLMQTLVASWHRRRWNWAQSVSRSADGEIQRNWCEIFIKNVSVEKWREAFEGWLRNKEMAGRTETGWRAGGVCVCVGGHFTTGEVFNLSVGGRRRRSVWVCEPCFILWRQQGARSSLKRNTLRHFHCRTRWYQVEQDIHWRKGQELIL